MNEQVVYGITVQLPGQKPFILRDKKNTKVIVYPKLSAAEEKIRALRRSAPIGTKFSTQEIRLVPDEVKPDD